MNMKVFFEVLEEHSDAAIFINKLLAKQRKSRCMEHHTAAFLLRYAPSAISRSFF